MTAAQPQTKAERVQAGLREAKKLMEAAIEPLDKLGNQGEIIALLKEAIKKTEFRLDT